MVWHDVMVRGVARLMCFCSSQMGSLARAYFWQVLVHRTSLLVLGPHLVVLRASSWLTRGSVLAGSGHDLECRGWTRSEWGRRVPWLQSLRPILHLPVVDARPAVPGGAQAAHMVTLAMLTIKPHCPLSCCILGPVSANFTRTLGARLRLGEESQAHTCTGAHTAHMYTHIQGNIGPHTTHMRTQELKQEHIHSHTNIHGT